jgi:hypothetical protein
MIFARGTTEQGRQLFIIGLSRLNMKRLKAGYPIRVRKETHGEGVPEGWEIMIMSGDTEIEMALQLERSGRIDSKTKIKTDPRLGS